MRMRDQDLFHAPTEGLIDQYATFFHRTVRSAQDDVGLRDHIQDLLHLRQELPIPIENGDPFLRPPDPARQGGIGPPEMVDMGIGKNGGHPDFLAPEGDGRLHRTGVDSADRRIEDHAPKGMNAGNGLSDIIHPIGIDPVMVFIEQCPHSGFPGFMCNFDFVEQPIMEVGTCVKMKIDRPFQYIHPLIHKSYPSKDSPWVDAPLVCMSL